MSNQRITENKNILLNYLHDFHPNRRETIMSSFIDSDFNKGITVFRSYMKSKIKMPKIGKNSIGYWLSRGWSQKESNEKRKKLKKIKPSPMSVNFWIAKDMTIEDAEFKVKSQRKTNKEFWISKGFSETDSIEKVKEFQKSNSEKLLMKRKNDAEYDKAIRDNNTTSINYWIKKGYTEEESKLKLKERQTTFSLQKCIEKYGDKNGTAVWQRRQDKWSDSLKKSDYNGRDRKDSKTISYFKNKFGENWIEFYIKSIHFTQRKNIYYLLSFENFQDMIDTLLGNNLKYSKIKQIIKPLILQEYYSCTFEEMKNYLSNNYGLKPKKSFEYYKKIYPENWLEKAIENETYKDKQIIKELLSFTSYEKMVDFMIGKYSVTYIVQKLKNKIISYYYETNFNDMFNYLVSKDPFISAKFGHMRYFNGHLCRSDGEFILANFLKQHHILYEYEKKYPESNKRCDFYLVDTGFYIEYTGMSKYVKDDRYELKKEFCIQNDLKHFFSSDINQIKKKIEELYEIENNS
jgi:hypothetical protein